MSRDGERHLELGLFAPTVGRMEPIGPPTMYLVSEVPQDVSITYDANRELARILDRGGLEFFFMAQRGGRGFGESRFWSHALDSFTVAAAIAEATERLRVVSTVHTAFYHPAMVARMGATLDQISGGRWGLNLVSGWAKPEFDMIGVPFHDHGARYRQTEEFTDILRLCSPLDNDTYEGEFYTVRGGYGQPKPAGSPLLFNAGASDAAREFVARHCDWYFTGALSADQLRDDAVDIRARAARHGRTIKVIVYLFGLIRDTREEAQAEVEEIMARRDDDAARALIEGISGQSLGTFAKGFGEGVTPEELLHNTIIGVGSGKLIGTHADAAESLAAYQDAGLDGAVFCFRNFEADTRSFIDNVVPLLERRGVRQPRTVRTAAG